jgi:hypothetical protein
MAASPWASAKTLEATLVNASLTPSSVASRKSLLVTLTPCRALNSPAGMSIMAAHYGAQACIAALALTLSLPMK